VQALLYAYPASAYQPTRNGNLPLHEACLHTFDGEGDGTDVENTTTLIQMLIDAYPEAMSWRNQSGKRPKDIARACMAPASIIRLLYPSPMSKSATKTSNACASQTMYRKRPASAPSLEQGARKFARNSSQSDARVMGDFRSVPEFVISASRVSTPARLAPSSPTCHDLLRGSPFQVTVRPEGSEHDMCCEPIEICIYKTGFVLRPTSASDDPSLVQQRILEGGFLTRIGSLPNESVITLSICFADSHVRYVMVQYPDSSQGHEELVIKEMILLQDFTSIQVTSDLLQREGLESSSLNASVIQMGMALWKAKRE
jgi:hypothetical protein